MADAYYVLSDPKRKREYDVQWDRRSFNERTPDPDASANFFANFANFFSGPAAGASSNATPPEDFGERPNAENVFGDVFEEVRSLYPNGALYAYPGLTILTVITPRGQQTGTVVDLGRRR